MPSPPNDADRAQARRFAEDLAREIAAFDHRLGLFQKRLERLEQRRETLQARRVQREMRTILAERAALVRMHDALRARFRLDGPEGEAT